MAKVNWKLNDVVTPDDMNLIGEEINQANIGVDQLKENGSTTDNMIGDRTIIDTAAPTANTGKLTTLLGSLAYMIKSITGKSSWRTAPATTLEAAKAHMDDTTKHITAAERTSWNAKETTTGAQTKVDAHGNLTNNPHAVTKAQVGLSNVGNYGLATQAEAEAGASDAKYMTPLRTKEAIQKLVPTPTKADVGLSNVDNVKQATKTEFDAHAVDAVKHITAAERTGWNAKASTTVATSAANGLMSAADKTKLDGVAANANNYVHPANHPASIIAQDASNRFVTDAEKAAWNAKASTSVATTSAIGLMSAADKSKLDGVAAGANNYTHPSTHPPSIIAQDASNRFMTDAERTKLSGIATGANNYTHPATHPPSIIAQDASNRFVTDTEKANWNAKAPLASPALTGTPTAPTPAVGNKTTQLSNTTYVVNQIDSQTRYGTTTGTATALVLTLSPAPTSLYSGIEIKIKLHVATGTNPTLNVNGLGAKALYDADGARFSGGENGKIYAFIYDGTNFILRSGGGGGGRVNLFVQPTQPAIKDGIWLKYGISKPNIPFVIDNQVWQAQEWNDPSMVHFTPFFNDNNGYDGNYKSFLIKGFVYLLFRSWAHSTSEVLFRYDTDNDTFTQLTYSRPTDLPFATLNQYQYGDHVYVLGGSGNGSDSGAQMRFCHKYDIVNNVYTPIAQMPTGYANKNITDLNGKIYVQGGGSSSANSTYAIHSYDITANTWSVESTASLTNLTNDGAAVGAYASDIIFLGGRRIGGSGVFAYVNKFNTVTKTWMQLPNAPYAFGNPSYVVVDGKIYISESRTTTKIPLTNMMIYDMATDTWSVGPAKLDLVTCTSVFVPSKKRAYFFGKTIVGSTVTTHTRALFFDSKKFDKEKVVLTRLNEKSGKFLANLIDIGLLKNMILNKAYLPFNDVFLYTDNDLKSVETYIGDGVSWVNFK